MSLRNPCIVLCFSLAALLAGAAAGQQGPAESGKLTTKALKKVLEDGGLSAVEGKDDKGNFVCYISQVIKGNDIFLWVEPTGEYILVGARLGNASGTLPAGITAGLLKANSAIVPYAFAIRLGEEYFVLACPVPNVNVTPKLLRDKMEKLEVHLKTYRDLWDDRLWSIDGEWTGISANKKGIDDPTLKSIKFSIKNNTIEYSEGRKTDTWKFTLAPEKTPRAIDITKGETSSLGIYQIKGDDLILCMAKPGLNRPSEFTSDKDSENTVMVLRRAGQSPFDGEWTVVRDTFPEGKKQQKWLINGNKIKSTRGDQILHSKFKLRPDKAPNAIDIEAERVFPGIYQLKGDELTICIAIAEGDNRPTEFTAPNGGNNVLIVLKKAPKAVSLP